MLVPWDHPNRLGFGGFAPVMWRICWVPHPQPLRSRDSELLVGHQETPSDYFLWRVTNPKQHLRSHTYKEEIIHLLPLGLLTKEYRFQNHGNEHLVGGLVSTHFLFKNSQIGSFPQGSGVKIKIFELPPPRNWWHIFHTFWCNQIKKKRIFGQELASWHIKIFVLGESNWLFFC